MALDRRRVAQINNQVASINRLLVDGSYQKEMRALHEGSAVLLAERDEALDALRLVLSAAKSQDGGKLADALNVAEDVVCGPQPGTDGVDPFRDAVSASGASAG